MYSRGAAESLAREEEQELDFVAYEKIMLSKTLSCYQPTPFCKQETRTTLSR